MTFRGDWNGNGFYYENETKGKIIFTQLLVRGAAGVHEGLSHNRQAAVHDVSLAQVEHKVGVLDEVNPEPRKYAYFTSYAQTN